MVDEPGSWKDELQHLVDLLDVHLDQSDPTEQDDRAMLQFLRQELKELVRHG